MNKINIIYVAALVAALIMPIAACAPDSHPVSKLEAKTSNKSETEKIVRDYLMTHPDIVVEIVNNAVLYQKQLDEAQKTSALQQARPELTQTGIGSFARGQGDITLVEFFDYQCGYCKKAFNDMLNAVSKDKAVRIVLKEFPILGEVSEIAAQAAMASQSQGLYMKFHTALMTTPGRLSEAKIFLIAEQIGLDTKKLRQDMRSPAIQEAIAKNRALAERLSVSGTPAFILIGKGQAEFVPGARDEAQFADLFKQARAK